MKNSIELGDFVTLEDDVQYQVCNILDYEEEKYFLFIDLNNLKNSKILYFEGNDLIEVEDPKLLEKLTLHMTKNVLKDIK